uniref:GGDEF domain-containing protein n=1 Tax=Plectus sambesii TaxID=2011161 RepID=A0A914V2H2_9BILA
MTTNKVGRRGCGPVQRGADSLRRRDAQTGPVRRAPETVSVDRTENETNRVAVAVTLFCTGGSWNDYSGSRSLDDLKETARVVLYRERASKARKTGKARSESENSLFTRTTARRNKRSAARG